MKSPVLFVIFLREDTTRKVFERIREAKPPRLYVAADGPRPGRPDDIEKCKATRSIINEVDWDCEVKTLFREKNLGCGKGVSSAITWFFENEEQGIILEDDILPNKEFFQFCDEMLDLYKNDERIQLVAGYNAFFDGYEAPYSYYMSKFLPIWGWASWRRVWNTYNLDAAKIDKVEFLSKLKTRYSKPVYRHYKSIFNMMSNHKNDTWDYQFFFNQIMFDRYSIIPFKNLTANIGCGTGDASHASSSTDDYIQRIINHHSKTIYPLSKPESIYLNTAADDMYAKLSRWEQPTLVKRIINRVVREIRKV